MSVAGGSFFGWLLWFALRAFLILMVLALLLALVASGLYQTGKDMGLPVDTPKEWPRFWSSLRSSSPVDKEKRNAVQAWMDKDENRVAGWWNTELEDYTYHGEWQSKESGYDAMPVNLALLGRSRLRCENSNLDGFPESWWAGLSEQQIGESWLFPNLAGGVGSARKGLGVLLVKRTPNFALDAGNFPFSFTLKIEPLEEVGLRIGRHRAFVPQSSLGPWIKYAFGKLPLTLDDGTSCDWQAHISFVPLGNNSSLPAPTEEVRDNAPAVRVPSPALSSDYYTSHYHEVELVDGMSPSRLKPQQERANTVQLSSQKVREAYRGTQVPKAVLLRIATQAPFLVYVVVRFDGL
jgi:hypothetical protein